MTKFENYLIEKGWLRFRYDNKLNKYIEDQHKQDYSSYGPTEYQYKKDNKLVVFGLHAQNLPPALIFPIFWSKTKLDNGLFEFNQLTPQQSEKYIKDLSNEDLLNIIEHNNTCFDAN